MGISIFLFLLQFKNCPGLGGVGREVSKACQGGGSTCGWGKNIKTIKEPQRNVALVLVLVNHNVFTFPFSPRPCASRLHCSSHAIIFTLFLIVKATAWKTQAEVIKVENLSLLNHFPWNRGWERKAAGGEKEITGVSFFRLFIRDHQFCYICLLALVSQVRLSAETSEGKI